MNSESWPERVVAGPWLAERGLGELRGPAGSQRLEPKVMDLFCLLANEPGRVWTREQLMATLWPGLVVGDDSLARTVSKLRHALGDDARAPQWIETIAKRGYRWIPGVEPVVAEVPPIPAAIQPDASPNRADERDRYPRQHWSRLTIGLVLVVGLSVPAWLWFDRSRHASDGNTQTSGDNERLLVRADDHYFQFDRADNEAALELYQRVLNVDPENPAALAGVANALTQRAIRWPTPPGAKAIEFRRLADALEAGHMAKEPIRSQLRRARELAEAAVERAPNAAAAHKALGLVLSAQGNLDQGLIEHQRAIELDPQAWPAMINLADVLTQLGRNAEARHWFEQAYAAMDQDYAKKPAQVQHWQEALGILIGDRYRSAGDWRQAETWYRRVLTIAPLDPEATGGLAAVLIAGGDSAAATRLCEELTARVGHHGDCPRTAASAERTDGPIAADSAEQAGR